MASGVDGGRPLGRSAGGSSPLILAVSSAIARPRAEAVRSALVDSTLTVALRPAAMRKRARPMAE
jgi:hypothetical protein